MIFIVVPNYSEETDVHDIPPRTKRGPLRTGSHTSIRTETVGTKAFLMNVFTRTLKVGVRACVRVCLGADGPVFCLLSSWIVSLLRVGGGGSAAAAQRTCCSSCFFNKLFSLKLGTWSARLHAGICGGGLGGGGEGLPSVGYHRAQVIHSFLIFFPTPRATLGLPTLPDVTVVVKYCTHTIALQRSVLGGETARPLCDRRETKQLLSLWNNIQVKHGIHFMISFQYFMNSIVITVKAGFFIIYEGTLRRCVFLVVL